MQYATCVTRSNETPDMLPQETQPLSFISNHARQTGVIVVLSSNTSYMFPRDILLLPWNLTLRKLSQDESNESLSARQIQEFSVLEERKSVDASADSGKRQAVAYLRA